MSAIPKAVLYYSPVSVWSAVALLALEEKGYGDDEVDRREVDLGKGENFDPSFLRLNPKATVPTLVVPLQKTLSEDVESRYKAITETKSIVEFLDKSRSAMSRTHTTSSAPAPALTPATIAFTATCAVIIDGILHAHDGDPNNLRYLNAHDAASLKVLAEQITPLLTGKQTALAQYIAEAEGEKIHVSEKVKTFWREKKYVIDARLNVLNNAGKETGELDNDAAVAREEFLKTARQAWQEGLKNTLAQLNKEILGPYTLGDQFSIADLHLAGWIASVVSLVGGTAEDTGATAMDKLEAHMRETKGTIALSKLAVFWDVMKERASWRKVYAGGLY